MTYYQVIEMESDYEPWWFLENWQEQIVKRERFDDYDKALLKYQMECERLIANHVHVQRRGDWMTVCWDPKEIYWCEACCDELQPYHSLLLLEEGKFPFEGGSHFSEESESVD